MDRDPHNQPLDDRKESLEERYAKSYIGLILFLTAIILLFPLLQRLHINDDGAWITWLATYQNTITMSSTAAIICLLVRPVLRTLQNTSAISAILSNLNAVTQGIPELHTTIVGLNHSSGMRAIVSNILQNVSRFSHPAVSVESRVGHSDVIAAVEKYDNPLIFLGFADERLVRNLCDLLKTKQRGALYVNPRVLPALISVIDHGDVPVTIYITDCPESSAQYLVLT